MDKNPIILSLNKEIPGSVLDSQRFGKSRVQSLWIESQAIEQVAKYLKNLSSESFDQLENLSVVEFEDVIVVNYFVSSSNELTRELVLRVSLVPEKANSWVELPSVASIWPMADSYEREASEMFGIRFLSKKQASHHLPKLPEDWVGFPMRKNYVFPKQYGGIQHQLTQSKSMSKKQST